MDSHLAASGIRFNDCFFTEPVALAAWTPPKCAGLFGILVTDPNWAPKGFQPIYFGEFGNNSTASALLQECSHMVASANAKQLYVSVFPMPFSTTQQRWALRNELIWAYNPACQTDSAKGPSRDLAYKLAELEKKHQQQTEQMMQLMAGMNPAMADPPPARRRRIGFLPFAEPVAD
jgi:hypothetical protein